MAGPYWRLPIWVRWHGNMARVRPAGTITKLMLEALLARFAELGTHNGQDWFLTEQRLKENAVKAENSAREADLYISWIAPDDRPSALTDAPDGMQEFFEYTALAGHAETPAEAQVRFGAFCQIMLHWLLNKKRPVDLGFIELHPLPVRPNWREFIGHRYAAAKRRGAGMDWNQWIKPWITKGVLLMSDHWKRTAYWTVTVKHTMTWWRNCAKTERARVRRLRNWRVYFLELAEFLMNKRETLHVLFKDYVAQARRPHPKLPPGGLYRLSNSKKNPEMGSLEKYRRFSGAGARLDTRVRSKVAARVVAGENPGLPYVPDLQPQGQDVRAGGDESGNGTVGTE